MDDVTEPLIWSRLQGSSPFAAPSGGYIVRCSLDSAAIPGILKAAMCDRYDVQGQHCRVQGSGSIAIRLCTALMIMHLAREGGTGYSDTRQECPELLERSMGCHLVCGARIILGRAQCWLQYRFHDQQASTSAHCRLLATLDLTKVFSLCIKCKLPSLVITYS